MGYLKRLIERATDTELNLENNRIGNYRITPQHGNVLVYHILKINDFKRTSNHFSEIKIDPDLKKVNVGLVKDKTNNKEIEQLHDFFHNAYCDFNITFENI
jgi:hypothetical protein